MNLLRKLGFRFYCSSLEKTKLIAKRNPHVPQKPIDSKVDISKLPSRTKIDESTIALLERLSLVDCSNKKGIETLEDAIAFADQILQVNTEGVDPLVTVLENHPLHVREDEITEGNCLEDILKNAALTEEDFFVAPPGNIPLEPRENLLHEEIDNNKKVRMNFMKIIELCEKHNILKTATKNGPNILQVGPVGALLLENLKNEWLFSSVTNRDLTVFLSKNSFLDTFEYAREICLERLPFGVAQMLEKTKRLPQSDDKIDAIDLNSFNLSEDNLELKNTTFVGPTDSTHLFHQWQRQRRAWWRKFSASPGRYILTDITTNDAGNQNVEIQAKYAFGDQVIEKIHLCKGAHNILPLEKLQLKEGRKKVQANFVTSTVSLATLFLNTISDSYEEIDFQNEKRHLLQLHRKLAPYKVSFAVSATQSSVNTELNQLALYLCKLLRANQISTLLLPSASKHSLETQWNFYDRLGIPYNILLKDSTLKNGIVFLRSRDTTLKEQVHVSTLQNYVQKIFANY